MLMENSIEVTENYHVLSCNMCIGKVLVAHTVGLVVNLILTQNQNQNSLLVTHQLTYIHQGMYVS